MWRLLVVIATVAIVSSEFYAESNQKKHCCTPQQWENAMWATGGSQPPGRPKSRSVSVSGNAFLSFDKTRQRFYIYVNATLDRLGASVKILQDYKSGFQYTINMNKNTCATSNITTPMYSSDGCVPDNAKYLARTYYGIEEDKFYVKVYKLQVVNSAMAFVDFLMMSDEHCIPVSESIVGTFNRFAIALRMNYFQTTLGIKDPSVFNVPAICNKNATDGPSMSYLEALFGDLEQV